MRSDATAQSGGGATLWTYVMRRSVLPRRCFLLRCMAACAEKKQDINDIYTMSHTLVIYNIVFICRI